MADDNTTNYLFILPEIGASKDSWGNKLNGNFSILDGVLKQISDRVTTLETDAGGGDTPTNDFTTATTFSGYSGANVVLGSGYMPLQVATKGVGVTTHGVPPSDIANPTVPSEAYSILTRAMGDVRYAKTGEASFYSTAQTYVGNPNSEVVIGGSGGPFAVYRGSTPVYSMWNADVMGNGPSSASSILSRAMGDARYTRLSSDFRYKDNVVDVESQLDDFAAMRVVGFNYIDTDDDTIQYGLIAQELQKIKPELVTEDTKGFLGIRYPALVPLLIKAIQELIEKVDRLENA